MANPVKARSALQRRQLGFGETLEPKRMMTGLTVYSDSHLGHPTVIEDLDGDGFLDFATFVQDGPEIRIYVEVSTHDGLITTSHVGKLSRNFYGFDAETGDFNGDGTTDVVFWDLFDGTMQTFISNSDFTFQPPINQPLLPNGGGMISVETDGDGRHELATSWRNDRVREIAVGDFVDGKWQFSSNPNLAGLSSRITEDLNRDGRVDFVSSTDVRYGGVDGIGPAEPLGDRYNHLVTGDFNGDGIQDLAGFPSESLSQFHILLGNSDGTFTKTTTIEAGKTRAVVGDLNGDGFDDVLFSLYPNANRMFEGTRYLVAYGAQLDDVFRFDSTDASNPYATQWLVDVNHDGYLDLVESPGQHLDQWFVRASGEPIYVLNDLDPSIALDVVLGSKDGLDFSNRSTSYHHIGSAYITAADQTDSQLRLILVNESSYLILGSDKRDLNQDGVVSAADIDAICRISESAASTFDTRFDLNRDQVINDQDVDSFINDLLQIQRGDIDLDGDVDFADFLQLSANYATDAAEWAGGDFNCDARVDAHDFDILLQNFGR